MEKNDLRLYYKNQLELGYALRDFIDAYFQNKVLDKELEDKITSVIEANKDKFYKGSDIAQKPKQILGKTRLNVLYGILSKRGGDFNEENSNIK
ncbi:TIGR04540 family protein [Clostridium mediterraneense]|uniref:TIGR04540 family protein n=1 Tax=Clostridium mediterraneense TaxID=1805472 RepID=UPI00082FA6BF|nr:TIGR04540 family protein [Clostridium mediterraneense]